MLTTMIPSLLAFAMQDPEPAGPIGSAEPNAAALHERIHDLRKDLLSGGESVQRAEEEAIAFYETKMEALNEQTDHLSVDLAEKRAQYDLALDRTLTAETDADRRAAAAEASTIRREIVGLENELDGLDERRGELANAIQAVEEKIRERELLVSEFESTGVVRDPMISPGSLGLAPSVPPDATLDPLEDADLLTDLMARDPEGARALILQSDPDRYWRLWPLSPNAETLRKAIRFPLGDPPELR